MKDKDIASFYNGFFTNHTTPNKRENMPTQISIADWLASTITVQSYPFQPLTKAHRTADYYLDIFIKALQNRYKANPIYGRFKETKQLHGRIIRTSCNYIASGYNHEGNWIEIPCANLNTAKIYMASFMHEDEFRLHSNKANRDAIEVITDWYGMTTWYTK